MRTPITSKRDFVFATEKIAATLMMGFAISCSSYAAESPADRGVAFLTNVYSGQTMSTEEWLANEARIDAVFRAFGGLDALVKQSTELANKFGGLRAVTVRDVKRDGDTYHVVIEVTFMQNHRTPPSEAMATQEDIVWDLQIRNQDGVWKITW